MGGPGSGWRGDRKSTVEECFLLKSNQFDAASVPGEGSVSGSLIWNGIGGDAILVAGYRMTRSNGDLRVTLEAASLPSVTEVALAPTRPFFGGVRWWFLCPGLPSGARCKRRTTTLYLPMRVWAFACRVCHRLTCDSVQRHDGRLS